MKYTTLVAATLITILNLACKKKDKSENGLSVSVVDCQNKPLSCLLKVHQKNGTIEEYSFRGTAIQIQAELNSSLKIDYITSNDTVSIDYPIGKGFNSVTAQICSGLKFSFSSKIIGTSGTALFGNLFTPSNYSIRYNSQNQSTYIVAPLQALSVDATFPWQTGYLTLKIKGKNTDDLFSNTPLNISLSNDTSLSYMAFGMYSTDSAHYAHQHFISNNLASISFNANKLQSTKFMEANFSSPVTLPGNFNGLNKPFGTANGTDLLGGTLEVKKQ